MATGAKTDVPLLCALVLKTHQISNQVQARADALAGRSTAPTQINSPDLLNALWVNFNAGNGLAGLKTAVGALSRIKRAQDEIDKLTQVERANAHAVTQALTAEIRALTERVMQEDRAEKELALQPEAVVQEVASVGEKIHYAAGPQGEAGKQGARGPQGPPGEKGDSPEFQWDGSKLRFKKPDGTWGAWADLAGQKGERGQPGARGSRTSPGFDLASLSMFDDALGAASFAVIQDGELRLATSVQMRAWLGTPPYLVTENGVYLTTEDGERFFVTVDGDPVVATP